MSTPPKIDTNSGDMSTMSPPAPQYLCKKGKYELTCAVQMLPGDVIHIPANVKHWHGAAADSWGKNIKNARTSRSFIA